MFEAALLLALLGVILWFVLSRERENPVRRASFIDLSAELKPASKKSRSKWR